MRFYRKEVRGANGEVVSKDLFDNGTLVGELTAEEIKHYPTVFANYVEELKKAGKEAPNLVKLFQPGELQVDYRADSDTDGLPHDVEIPVPPAHVDANGVPNVLNLNGEGLKVEDVNKTEGDALKKAQEDGESRQASNKK